MKAHERRKISNALHPITSTYHDYIPLQSVIDILNSFGYLLLQEDNTPWSGLLCGREANTIFTIGKLDTKDERNMYAPIKNGLYFYWYKLESGRYEVNMYIT